MSDEPLCVSYSKWKASIFSHEAVVLHFQNKQPSKTKDVGVQFSSAHKAEKEEARNWTWDIAHCLGLGAVRGIIQGWYCKFPILWGDNFTCLRWTWHPPVATPFWGT